MSDALQREVYSLKSMKEMQDQRVKKRLEYEHSRLLLNQGMSYNRITLEKIQKQKALLASFDAAT